MNETSRGGASESGGRFISIRLKLAFLIAIAPVSVALIDAAIVPEEAAEAEKNALRVRAQGTASMLAIAVGPALEFGQTDQMQDALDQVVDQQSIADLRWAAVYDASGARTVAVGSGSRTRLVRRRSGEIEDTGSEIVAVSGIEAHRDTLGYVAVSFERGTITARRNQTRQNIVLRAVAFTVVAVLVALWTAGRMSSSIRAMRDAAERIARGDVSGDLLLSTSRDELGAMADAFRFMNVRLRELQQNAARVAAGDLRVVPDGRGELYSSFRSMVLSLRKLVGRIGDSSDAVASAAAQLFAATREHEASATQQTASVEEMRRTLEALAKSAEQVNSDALTVRESAERSLTSSTQTADQTKLVSAHSERIGEILTLIQDIADKSDLLALNAALEGTKAGEVGRGFSLVAAEMRRLSEHVMDSVRDIRKLVADTRAASHASVLATEESIKLARESATSAVKISSAVGLQREGTSQVKSAADEIARVVGGSLEGTGRITRSAEALLQLSAQLRDASGAFQWTDDGSSRAIDERES